MDNTEIEFARNMADPMWRICNLYKIIVKGDDEDSPDYGLVMPFRPNSAQLKFLNELHYRNIILKARQLGFTTAIAIAWLDHALFNSNSRCGIIAQDLEAAQVIFRDKVKFAYENLAPEFRDVMPLKQGNSTELLFAHNNSSVRVATSMRSGTIHRLHISEFGIICSKSPEKADEIMTGSIPAVPLNGITVVESTAKGTDGEFFDMTQRAMAMQNSDKQLTKRDWRFHFFPWFGEQRYRMDPSGVTITQADHDNFDIVEQKMGVTLDIEQRAWYVSTRDNDYAGKEEKMLQEYPSTPEEAFRVSTDGNWLAKQMVQARKQGRICNVPILDLPVHTFWDIGNSDGTGIWFYQRVGQNDNFIDYEEAHGEPYLFFARLLKEKGYLYANHYLPHDADHERQGQLSNKTPREMLADLGITGTIVVPRVHDITVGINLSRKHLASSWFDETRCKEGIAKMENYKKKWNKADGRWSDEPDKSNGCSECADAYRQFAQAKEAGLIKFDIQRPRVARAAPDWRT